MKFKVSLQNGEKLDMETDDINSVEEFANIIGRMEAGRFIIVGKTAINKDYVVTIQEIG